MAEYLTKEPPKPWWLRNVLWWWVCGCVPAVALIVAIVAPRPDDIIIYFGFLTIALCGAFMILNHLHDRHWRTYRSRVSGVTIDQSIVLAVYNDENCRAWLIIELENGHRFRAVSTMNELGKRPYVTYERRGDFLGVSKYRNVAFEPVT